MRTNVGKTDKLIRIATGLILLSVLFWVEGAMRYIGLLGIVFLGTAFWGVCPLYIILGISTCSIGQKKQ